jgi:predicted alpha/beta-fold hydrolase
MASIIAQLAQELNSKYSKYQIYNILENVMEKEIEKIKDFDGFDPANRGAIHGIRIMAKALHDELEQRGD